LGSERGVVGGSVWFEVVVGGVVLRCMGVVTWHCRTVRGGGRVVGPRA